MTERSHDLTEALAARVRGEERPVDELLPALYSELRAIAGRFMAGERREHTLEPTALVHEAYLRLVDQSRIDWQGKTHFLALAARQMRRVLVDHARARGAEKRGGGRRADISLERLEGAESDHTVDVLAVHEALGRLATENERRARVVELRFFGGLTQKETAYVMGISERTVRDDWTVARAWLLRELKRAG
jgi:RNA polymerase sigma factor (TIGR02999 family)